MVSETKGRGKSICKDPEAREHGWIWKLSIQGVQSVGVCARGGVVGNKIRWVG